MREGVQPKHLAALDQAIAEHDEWLASVPAECWPQLIVLAHSAFEKTMLGLPLDAIETRMRNALLTSGLVSLVRALDKGGSDA